MERMSARKTTRSVANENLILTISLLPGGQEQWADPGLTAFEDAPIHFKLTVCVREQPVIHLLRITPTGLLLPESHNVLRRVVWIWGAWISLMRWGTYLKLSCPQSPAGPIRNCAAVAQSGKKGKEGMRGVLFGTTS